MAFTSIKVRDEDKRAFDRLRHEFALQAGEDLSQHEVFHRILEHALASKTSLLGPQAKGRKRSWAKFRFDIGEATDAAAEVDRVVYGLEP